MATSGVGGYRDNYGNYGTGSTSGSNNEINAVFDNDKKGVEIQDFLNLMVAQLQNQDFMNPVDDTQYVTQLAQFATMQSMSDMSAYMKTNYVLSLIGQKVTAARITVSGALEKEEGYIDKISLVDNEYVFYVNDKKFTLEQIMEFHNEKKETEKPSDGDGDGDDKDPETKPVE